ncbi:MAG TPA: hypothetical protein DCX79_21355 [Planctomycetaceae bacterium]|nr:hypothetical protein [Planctomycetaceae bacterium]
MACPLGFAACLRRVWQPLGWSGGLQLSEFSQRGGESGKISEWQNRLMGNRCIWIFLIRRRVRVTKWALQTVQLANRERGCRKTFGAS